MKTILMKMRNILALATLAMVCITATARPIRHRKLHPHIYAHNDSSIKSRVCHFNG